jgi:hypothetical protein
MGDLPREWERVPVFYNWPVPELSRRYDHGEVVLDAPEESGVIRSDTVADDLLDDLEKNGEE